MSEFEKIEYHNGNHPIEKRRSGDTKTKSSSKKILFICNTNLFISPVAEAIFNQKSSGEAISASLAVPIFCEPQFATIRTCQNHGIDISNYSITHISDIRMSEVGLILTATAEIRDYLKMQYPNMKIFTINEYSKASSLDIEDPIGGNYEGYEKCFNEIDQAISRIIIEEDMLIVEKPVESRSFQYLDDLIHSGMKRIVLNSDIVLDSAEESRYLEGIKLNVYGLTIDGNGHAIDAKGKTRIFYCTGNVTFENIILKNGFAEEYGGAIYNREGILTMRSSTLSENTADYGGAICNWNGEMTISGSRLRNNKAALGGAIENTGGELTIGSSTISENAAKYGGAIYNWGKLTITESALNENTAREGGGAISNEKGELTISESTLKGNSAQKGSGAIINHEGNFKIFNCEFSSNKSPNNIILNYDYLQIYNTDFKENQSQRIVSNTDNLSIFNGEFMENDIEDSLLYNNGKFCTVEKTVFENNVSGNAMNIINEKELTLTSPRITDKGKTILNQNYILIKKSSPNLENAIWGKGRVENIENRIPRGKTFDFGYLDKKIHESGTKEIILDHDINFENYEREFYEGGIELDTDGLIIDGNGKSISGAEKSRIFLITAKNITLKNIVFKNGYSHKSYDNPFNSNGGAIKINCGAGITIENCEFINNTSEEDGGAIQITRSELTIAESTLHENRADEGFGGAISNIGGEITIAESTLKTNLAGKNGGAIYNIGGRLTMMQSKIMGNASMEGGAALYIFQLTVYESHNCTFEYNLPHDIE